MTEPQKRLTEEEALAKAFNAFFLLIAENQDEAVKLLEKFGDRSDISKKKIAQIEGMKAFYNFTKAYINSMRELNYKIGINYRAMEIITMKHETGLTWRKCAELLGHKLDDYKKLDDTEHIFTEIRKGFAELERIQSLTTSDDATKRAEEKAKD